MSLKWCGWPEPQRQAQVITLQYMKNSISKGLGTAKRTGTSMMPHNLHVSFKSASFWGFGLFNLIYSSSQWGSRLETHDVHVVGFVGLVLMAVLLTGPKPSFES